MRKSGDDKWQVRFFLIWTGQAFSLFGSALVRFALIWWLTLQTGKATTVAIAVIITGVPTIIIGPFAGVIADRFSRRLVLIFADSLIAISTAFLILLFVVDKANIQSVYLVMLIRASGSAFHMPTMHASTTMLVPHHFLVRVASLNQLVEKAASFGAPPLAAFLLLIADVRGVLYIDVLTAILAIGPLIFTRIPQPRRDTQEEGIRSMLADLAEGFKFAWRSKGVRYLLLTILIGAIFMFPAFNLFPILISAVFKGGAMHLGVFEAIYAFAGIAGAAVLIAWGGFKRKIKTSLLGTSIVCGGMLMLSVVPANLFLLSLVAIGIVGFGLPIHGSPLHAIYQTVVPRQKQARFFAIQEAAINTSLPISMVIGGRIADVYGIRTVYYIATAAMIFFILTRSLIPSIRNIEALSTATEE